MEPPRKALELELPRIWEVLSAGIASAGGERGMGRVA